MICNFFLILPVAVENYAVEIVVIVEYIVAVEVGNDVWLHRLPIINPNPFRLFLSVHYNSWRSHPVTI